VTNQEPPPATPDPTVPHARPVTLAATPQLPAARISLVLPAISRLQAAAGFTTTILFLIAMIVISLVAQVLQFPDPDAAQPEQLHHFFIQQKWLSAAGVVAVAALLLHFHRLHPASIGLSTKRPTTQALWALATLVGLYAAHFVSITLIFLLILLVPPLQADLAHRIEFLELLPHHSLLLSFLLLIPVAIEEELLFRGLMIPYLRRLGCSWTGALIISTAIFASLHISQGALGIIQVFTIGCVFGLFFILSRSLTAVIIAHFVFDMMQIQLARLVAPLIDQIQQSA
jgi:membrane protease YdiL (CAAX protease family)